MKENKEETTQTVGKMRFVVVSQFQNNGSTINEKIKHLLEREAQVKNKIRTFDKTNQADYIE